MKTICILLLLLISVPSFSQIRLANTINCRAEVRYTVLEGIGEKYYALQELEDQYLLLIYNMDHSIYQEIRFKTPSEITFSYFEIRHVSTHLFNLDDKIEFALVGDCSGFVVLNEEGNPLLVSKNADGCRYELINKSNGALLFLPVNWSQVEVYELPGKMIHEYTTSTEIKTPIANLKTTTAFPNPAKTEVTITYELGQFSYGYLNIYDQSGVVVKTLAINKQNNSLTLNTSNLPKGLYIYEIRSSDNHPIGQPNKLLIQ
ncbi:MAG: T9SS type A sorting domain-containing protein [Breznakibacter sp.]|nr:T9SS type A sorting domain-containing protein [Breznakibacter sp.]